MGNCCGKLFRIRREDEHSDHDSIVDSREEDLQLSIEVVDDDDDDDDNDRGTGGGCIDLHPG